MDQTINKDATISIANGTGRGVGACEVLSEIEFNKIKKNITTPYDKSMKYKIGILSSIITAECVFCVWLIFAGIYFGDKFDIKLGPNIYALVCIAILPIIALIIIFILYNKKRNSKALDTINIVENCRLAEKLIVINRKNLTVEVTNSEGNNGLTCKFPEGRIDNV